MSEHLRNPKYAAAVKAANLTDRQSEVLNYWLDGHSMYTIARAIGITESTARGHFEAALKNILPHMPRKEAA